MVKYTDRNGNDYVLRFDMNAMSVIAEKYGSYADGMKKLQESAVNDYAIVLEIFEIMAQAGEDYTAEKIEHRPRTRISADGLLDKYSSPGKLRGIVTAIFEAVKDGNKTQLANEDDDQVRDGYLKELQELEREKN